jgi:hypothetical protein
VVKFPPTGLFQADRLPDSNVKELDELTGFVAQVESLDQWSVVARLYDWGSSKVWAERCCRLKVRVACCGKHGSGAL